MEQIKQSIPDFGINMISKIAIAILTLIFLLQFGLRASHHLKDLLALAHPYALCILFISFFDRTLVNYQKRLYGKSWLKELKRWREKKYPGTFLLGILAFICFFAEIGSVYFFGKTDNGWIETIFASMMIIFGIGFVSQKIGYFIAQIEYELYDINGQIKYPDYQYFV